MNLLCKLGGRYCHTKAWFSTIEPSDYTIASKETPSARSAEEPNAQVFIENEHLYCTQVHSVCYYESTCYLFSLYYRPKVESGNTIRAFDQISRRIWRSQTWFLWGYFTAAAQGTNSPYMPWLWRNVNLRSYCGPAVSFEWARLHPSSDANPTAFALPFHTAVCQL